MRIFIAWSGSLSHNVALEIKKLLGFVFPSIDVFVSSEDIGKGKQWRTVVTEALAASQRGIICLTSDNYNQPWVLFEAGALTKALQQPILYTILIDDLEPSTLDKSPLSQFQHTQMERTDMISLLTQINRELEENCRTESDLELLFDKLWPDVENAISKLVLLAPKKIIKLTDYARESSIIAGKVFRNSVIHGPAILALLEGNSFESCVFESPSKFEGLLWTPMNPKATIGAIGVSRCRFENCKFSRIGLTGSPETLEAIRKSNA